jgi:hypothetical protein
MTTAVKLSRSRRGTKLHQSSVIAYTLMVLHPWLLQSESLLTYTRDGELTRLGLQS